MTVIKVENLSKLYRLGEVGTGTISHDLNRFFAKLRGKEDPFSKIGQINDRTKKAEKGEHVWALKDINFEVQQGEVLGVIGKNGAGKSTLLKLLSRVTAPTTGNIKVKGRIASLLEVGTGFHPEMTGRENVYMNGTIMGMRKKEIDRKLDEIIDFAGVAKYIDTPTKRYSSGMQVRLAFAVAAFLEPEILIVDEVLAVGDAEFQKRAIGKMQDISMGEGRTVLFVSHNMASMRNICNKAVLLERGKISKVGKVDSIIEHYIGSQNDIYYGLYENSNFKNRGFKSIKMIDGSNNLTSIFKFDSIIGFEINYDLEEGNKQGVVCSFNVEKNSSNVFSSFEYLQKLNNPIRIFLQKKNLLPGNYSVSFSLHKPNVELFDKTPFLSFTIEETGSDFNIFGDLSKFGGAYIKPVWE